MADLAMPRRVIAVGIIHRTSSTIRVTAGPGEICDLCGRIYYGNQCPRCTTAGPRPCGTCQGRGGMVEDTSSGGVTRQTWRPCPSCGGSGVAR